MCSIALCLSQARCSPPSYEKSNTSAYPHYAVAHSYIIELKYLAVKDSDSKAEAQWQDAVNQIRLYAAAPRVERLRQGTQLHCIIMQFRGCELERAEEVQV